MIFVEIKYFNLKFRSDGMIDEKMKPDEVIYEMGKYIECGKNMSAFSVKGKKMISPDKSLAAQGITGGDTIVFVDT